MHALVIEDNPVIAMLIEDELRELAGVNSVHMASTEAEAIAAAWMRCPDLIVSDVCLAEGNGVIAVRTIRDCCPVPVVFITGAPEQVSDPIPGAPVLEKPFTEVQFISAVQHVLGARTAQPRQSAEGVLLNQAL